MVFSSHPNNRHQPYTAKWYAREAKYKFNGWKLRRRHAIGLKIWPTKCFEFWLILQEMLYLVQPKTIVEFGSGRSTNYISEYVHKFGGNYLSFEQHLYYYLKFNIALFFLFLPWGTVRYAPLKSDWYNVEIVNRHLKGIKNIDFLFYDGPAILGKGSRASKSFFSTVTPFLQDVKMIVVDDVHRLEEQKVAQVLKDDYCLKRYYIYSICDHTRIALLLNQEAAEKIAQLPIYLQKHLEVD